MDKESLIKARNLIIGDLSKLKINDADKAELMMNLWLLLSEEHYDNSIKVLRKYGGRK